MKIQNNIDELEDQLIFDEMGIGFNHDTIIAEFLKEVLDMEEEDTLIAI